MDLSEITDRTVEAVREVGVFILEKFGQVTIIHAEEKSRNSLVSQVDVHAEKMLVKALKAILPEAGFVTEEGTTSQKNNSLYWVIDPLDGTTNFLFGLPCVSISVALRYKGDIVVGVIHHVNAGETYHTYNGGGAFKEGRPIRVSQRPSLEKSLIATGFPYESGEFLKIQLQVIEHLVHAARGVRRLGSAAIDLAYVAEGIFDAYFESGLNEWDTAAGMLLVREAGGMVSDLEGNLSYQEGLHIVAANSIVHNELLALIREKIQRSAG